MPNPCIWNLDPPYS